MIVRMDHLLLDSGRSRLLIERSNFIQTIDVTIAKAKNLLLILSSLVNVVLGSCFVKLLYDTFNQYVEENSSRHGGSHWSIHGIAADEIFAALHSSQLRPHCHRPYSK